MCNSYIEIVSLLGCYAAWIASSVPTFRDNLLVSFSMVKHDSGGKNCHSALRETPKDCRSHFIVDYTFPAKSGLFLLENQHSSISRAIMPQEAVNNCLTCIKCAEASYSGVL